MALSMLTSIARIRVLVAEVTGMKRVFASSETDSNRVPAAFNELPCALVLSGATLEYILMQPQHRHTYEVRVQIFESGPDIGTRVNTVLPFVDAIIEKFAVNVGLGGRVNSCIFDRQQGLVGLEYGGIEYTGYEIILRVSEAALANAAIGA